MEHAHESIGTRSPIILSEEQAMNVKKLLYLIIAMSSCAALLFFRPPVQGEEEATMKYTVIRLLADSIEPTRAIISQGTVIIWVNEAQGTAEIQFANREMATCLNGAPLPGGRTEQEMFFKIGFGKTESICLVQKGEFSYTVKRGSKSIPGTIQVK